MQTYMLILLATHELMHAERSPDEARKNAAAWQAWHEELEAAGRLSGGRQLTSEGLRVSAGGIDPLPEAPEDLVVGGYFLIEAESLDEARDLARGCPLVSTGGIVEVRPVLQA